MPASATTFVFLASLLLAQAQPPNPYVNAKPNTLDYGGTPYTGRPALSIASELIAVGAGAQNFQIAEAGQSFLGDARSREEYAWLVKHYGSTQVTTWANVWKFVVRDARTLLRQHGTRLPPNPNLDGAALAQRLVRYGMDPGTTFNTQPMLDHVFGHRVATQVLRDATNRFGSGQVASFITITNREMFRVSQMLGMKGVQLSSMH